MLRRASFAIYMAQKGDTFGKDSEASVALGQGKPVVVYVPKLFLSDGSIDTEQFFSKSRQELISLLEKQGEDVLDLDESVDEQVLVSRILNSKLSAAPDEQLIEAVRRHWADFDLYNETDRLKDDAQKAEYRKWLDSVAKAPGGSEIPKSIRADVIGILVAVAIRFEGRAKVFREIHPLALQVILSSGVLNGILVVRSVEQCADVLAALVRNDLKLDLQKDEQNYRLIESITGSTVRVISRHRLLRNAFEVFYSRTRLLS